MKGLRKPKAECSLPSVPDKTKRSGLPASLSIGAARGRDFEWCARLMAGIEPWITLRQDLAACRSKIRRPGNELFIARQGGRRLGFILVHPYGLAGSPYIYSIAVKQNARSRGLGSQLVAFVEKHFSGRRHLFLCVSSFNRRAQQLYSRLGFKRLVQFPNYVVSGHSEILYYKKLS